MTRPILRALNSPLLLILMMIAVALQSSLFTSGWMRHFQPDFVLILVVWLGLRRGFMEGGIMTLLLANLNEVHTAAPQGLFLISYMLVYFAVRITSRLFVIPNLFSYSLLTGGYAIFFRIICMIILYLLGSFSFHWGYGLSSLILTAITQTVFSRWIFRWLERFDWFTYKNSKAARVMDEELQLEGEGY
jgi:cell shape-determining protein MreD